MGSLFFWEISYSNSVPGIQKTHNFIYQKQLCVKFFPAGEIIKYGEQIAKNNFRTPEEKAEDRFAWLSHSGLQNFFLCVPLWLSFLSHGKL